MENDTISWPLWLIVMMTDKRFRDRMRIAVQNANTIWALREFVPNDEYIAEMQTKLSFHKHYYLRLAELIDSMEEADGK